MIIDSHAHVILPVENMIDAMDRAGVSKTILFSTSVHPENAGSLEELEAEMQALNRILSGQVNPYEVQVRSAEEELETIAAYPDRFLGFGRVPLKMTLDETGQWIKEKIMTPGLLGLGEFTPAPGQVADLETVFQASREWGSLPLWIHTFFPLGLEDIREIGVLSRRYPQVPVILGHLGGTNWMEAIRLAKNNPRIFLDISGVFTFMAPKMAIKELPEKTLFASDAPYGDPLLQVRMVEKSTADPFIQEQVLGGNIAALLNL